MTAVGQPERLTQNRVVQLFSNELDYVYLGNWEDRPDNSNIEEELLTQYLICCNGQYDKRRWKRHKACILDSFLKQCCRLVSYEQRNFTF